MAIALSARSQPTLIALVNRVVYRAICPHEHSGAVIVASTRPYTRPVTLHKAKTGRIDVKVERASEASA